MDSNVIFILKDYLKNTNVVDFATETNAVLQREQGKSFSFSEHIRALVYALLTNQREWSTVEPHLNEIDKLFFDYDVKKIKEYSGNYFETGIRNLKCGNISIKKQMENIHKNIEIFEEIAKEYGSMDNFVTKLKPKQVVETLSSYKSKYKIAYMGEALAWEYLRNVGISEAKPDTHLKRFFGSERMGISRLAEATNEEVLKEIELLAEVTGLGKFEIDYLIWCYCANGKGEICTANPKCSRCVIKSYCKKGGNN